MLGTDYQQKIELIKNLARELFTHARGSHDWDHTLRVQRLCLQMGKVENADLHVLETASLLHDIGREEQDKSRGKICHAEAGARMAHDILSSFFEDADFIDQVVHCIETHRFRNQHKPESLEAKILFDADKLDSIGAVGVGRAFLFAGEIGAKLHNSDIDITKTKAYTQEDTAYREFIFKLQKIRERMMTAEGQRLAKGRHQYMVGFFKEIEKEISGES